MSTRRPGTLVAGGLPRLVPDLPLNPVQPDSGGGPAAAGPPPHSAANAARAAAVAAASSLSHNAAKFCRT
ncbi:MAG: hypothetical protein NZ700_02810, partial [Gemmataceae bacterium]|nr:hypothetical protein [Gemmataceae bacterium]